MQRNFMEKILNMDQLDGVLDLLRSNQYKIVFTNGCFDILHPGHIDYLTKARQMGDALVIGLNTDASIRLNKGPQRPVNSLKTRQIMLAALECVDFVIPFEEETPINLIEKIQPDILVKGSDYNAEEIVGYDSVTDRGGKVLTLPLLEGYSTSAFIRKIKDLKE